MLVDPVPTAHFQVHLMVSLTMPATQAKKATAKGKEVNPGCVRLCASPVFCQRSRGLPFPLLLGQALMSVLHCLRTRPCQEMRMLEVGSLPPQVSDHRFW